jgi:hypothetical protein
MVSLSAGAADRFFIDWFGYTSVIPTHTVALLRLRDQRSQRQRAAMPARIVRRGFSALLNSQDGISRISPGTLMPHELRLLRFDNAEVAQALAAINPGNRSNIPTGNIISITETTADSSDVTIQTDNVTAGLVRVSRAQLAAALIVFCQRNRIPLPAAADKTVLIADGRVTLKTVLSEQSRRSYGSKAGLPLSRSQVGT